MCLVVQGVARRVCMVGVGARERMVGDKFTLYLMDGSECIIEVKPHRTKVNSI